MLKRSGQLVGLRRPPQLRSSRADGAATLTAAWGELAAPPAQRHAERRPRRPGSEAGPAQQLLSAEYARPQQAAENCARSRLARLPARRSPVSSPTATAAATAASGQAPGGRHPSRPWC